MKNKLSIIVMCLVFSSPAYATNFGIMFGKASVDEDGFDDDFGFRASLGVNVAENVSIEISYVDFGEFEADAQALNLISELTNISVYSAGVEVSGFELAAVGYLPLSEKLSLLGRFGIFLWDADINVMTSPFDSISGSDDGVDPLLGVGLNYEFAEGLILQAEFNRYEVLDADINVARIGFNIRFK